MLHSAGIIPYKFTNSDSVEFFVGHPGGHDDEDIWCFLKGQLDSNEDLKEAAIREFKEETGLDFSNISIENLIDLGTVKQSNYKRVTAFGLHYPNINPANCHSNLCEDNITPEIDKYNWFTFDELKNRTHPKHLVLFQTLLDKIKNPD